LDRYRHSAARVRYANRDKASSCGDISQRIYDDLAATLGSSSSPSSRGNDIPNDDERATVNRLRESVLVDRHAIRSHVARFVIRGGFEDNDGGAAVDDCVRQIQSFHRSLVFCPPIGDDDRISTQSSTVIHDGGEKIRLSTPSGLRNLGATCYLNSQLQCLSQNLGFVSGLSSWRKRRSPSSLRYSGTSDTADERMSNVLSNMQLILARMTYGPDRVLCTNDFASALSLESDEMQDPNEVSHDITNFWYRIVAFLSVSHGTPFLSRPQLLS
jgi:hypothetical protein